MQLPDLFYNRRMGNLFKHRRLHGLIVCMAILLNVLAPAISHAVTSLARDPLTADICSATPAGEQQPGKAPAHGMKHCAFCATHLDTYAPPPAAAGLLAVLDGHDAYPALHYQSPAPLFNWSSAQPRGPPALS
jgi:hypothetical protein